MTFSLHLISPHLYSIILLGYYFTGDGCRRDSDGYYWITGRVDDVINPSGHRIGTAEIESALVACPQVNSERSTATNTEVNHDDYCDCSI